jgi:hypothetical protein
VNLNLLAHTMLLGAILSLVYAIRLGLPFSILGLFLLFTFGPGDFSVELILIGLIVSTPMALLAAIY